MKKMLVISHVWPFPGHSGQEQRVRQSLSSLRKHFHVTFLTTADPNNIDVVSEKLSHMCDRVVCMESIFDRSRSTRLFHRVIGNFVIQGGGYDLKYVEKPTRAGAPNESGNGLSNRRGTVGLARTGDPHSGTAQFYVNLADNAALDPQPSRWGYAVFGRIVEGMKVVDDIGAVATGSAGKFDRDAPLQPVIIKRVEIVK